MSPFDEEEEQPDPKLIAPKNVSTQKSIFDSLPKKPTKEDFERKIKDIEDKGFSHKTNATELALQFKKAMEDKTLYINKSVFARELEKEILSKMINLAIDINEDENEKEGMGTLSWVTLLLKTCFAQRDKINEIEYRISQLEAK